MTRRIDEHDAPRYCLRFGRPCRLAQQAKCFLCATFTPKARYQRLPMENEMSEENSSDAAASPNPHGKQRLPATQAECEASAKEYQDQHWKKNRKERRALMREIGKVERGDYR